MNKSKIGIDFQIILNDILARCNSDVFLKRSNKSRVGTESGGESYFNNISGLKVIRQIQDDFLNSELIDKFSIGTSSVFIDIKRSVITGNFQIFGKFEHIIEFNI